MARFMAASLSSAWEECIKMTALKPYAAQAGLERGTTPGDGLVGLPLTNHLVFVTLPGTI
jgi:hypothetical protein